VKQQYLFKEGKEWSETNQLKIGQIVEAMSTLVEIANTMG